MPRNSTAQALDRLAYVLNNGSIDQLKQCMAEFEQVGLQKERLINFPIQRHNGRTTVHLAASNGMYDCLELLLKMGGNPNAVSSPTDLSQTPLHLASNKGYPKCIQLLLEHGANMEVKNTHRETAQNLVRGKPTCEKVFQHAIAKYKIPRRTNEQQKRVEALHEIIGLEESMEDFYRLYEQLHNDHKDLATRWTDFYQQTLLYRATSSGLTEVVDFMLSKSASQPLHNLDTNETPLLMAFRQGFYDIATALLKHSPKLLFISEARNSLSPLHVACSRGDTKLVQLLLSTLLDYLNSEDWQSDTEISLDFRDELGRTPLYNACYYGYTDIVKLLLDFQRENAGHITLNVNAAIRQKQRTPLHAAVRKGNIEIVEMLLAVQGIDVNLEGRPSGRTQAKVIENFQKNMNGHALPPLKKLSIPEEGSFDQLDIDSISAVPPIRSPDTILSPPGTRTPDSWSNIMTMSAETSNSRSSISSSSPSVHIDDSIGFVAPTPSVLTNHRGSVESLSKYHHHHHHHMPLKKKVKKKMSSEPPLYEAGTGRSYEEATTGSSGGGGGGEGSKKNSLTEADGIEKFAASHGGFPIGPKKKHSQSSVSDVAMEDGGGGGGTSAKYRSQTETRNLDYGKSNLKVVENPKTGRFEFQMKTSESSSSVNEFDQLFMTPLAEACACYHTKIVKLLLLHGARDDNGLACRIAYLMQQPDLMKLILAHHSGLKGSSSGGMLSGDEGPKSQANLELQWSHKKLPTCEGEWLGEAGRFYPMSKDHERDFDDTGYTSPSSDDPNIETETANDGSILEHSPKLKFHSNSISIVHLDHNQLPAVPIELFRLQNVQKINISNNKIAKLPVSANTFSPSVVYKDYEGWACPCLEELNVGRNELDHIPVCIWSLPHLMKLNLSSNRLKSLLPEVGSISDEVLSRSIEAVDLSSNQLAGKLSRFIFELPGLRTLNLSSNCISELPETLWECGTIQELNISDNQLKMLPWCQSEEEYEKLFHTRTQSLPLSMRQADKCLLGKVEVRAPSINRDKSIFQKAPSTIKPLNEPQLSSVSAITENYDYSLLQKLNLSRNKFAFVPVALPCFAPNLTDLDVSRNPLTEIDLQSLPFSLKKLMAKNCEIRRIGNVISRMSHSQVTRSCRCADAVGQPCPHRSHTHLPSLATIDISHNKLTSLQLIRRYPPEREGHNYGEEERVYDHKIAPALDLLYPALEGLNLGYNCLTKKFNPNIGHQTHLKWIILSKNPDLVEIPMEFAYLKNTKQLTELGMDELPNLVEPPPEYRNVSLGHLLTYMRSRLKESSYYRSIKLFFIGNGERGKTTLLRRLRGLPDDKKIERTEGIDIETWIYPDPKKFTWKEKRKPVSFLAWDFAGQDVYHTTHQCFYSKRSMYLALFRLCDGEAGIEELEQWLRNVQLRAPGSPVIIVGTHLDALSDPNRHTELEKLAFAKYSGSHYPKVVGVVSISCLKKLFSNQMEHLRNILYNVACHLSLGKDGVSLEYKPKMSETDPKALFQQQVPQTFLALQDKIREKVHELKIEGKSPIMEDSQFKAAFKSLFEDEEELNEAVYFLNLQGTLLHFEDHNLRNVFFLDPQWLAKLMADVIHPAAMGTAYHIVNGVAEISGLFNHRDILPSMKQRYISLLEKFEVALCINPNQMIIPSLMPESANYPKLNDTLSDVSSSMIDEVEGHYQPPLRRFWLADFVPAGFWPRLICRVATDHQIGKILRTIVGGNSPSPSPSESVDSLMDTTSSSSNNSSSAARNSDNASVTSSQDTRDILNWTPWKTGMAFSYRGRTLLIMQQVTNEPCDNFLDQWEIKLKLLNSKYRIEIHIYINEWVALFNELLELGCTNFMFENFECIPGLATKLLVMIASHVKTLAVSWFPGMIKGTSEDPFVTYIPCWKCYSEIGTSSSVTEGLMKGSFVCKDMNPVSCFVLQDHVVTAALEKPLKCSLHGDIKIMHMAPDLIFWDLTCDVSYQDSNAPLHICEDEVLGKGGFGFVCKGELKISSNHGAKKNVAVKVFLRDISQIMETTSISELLELSKKDDHLNYAYKEIRQEVSFLSNLDHPHLTKLCGVRTSPYMCLVLELAPKKSLRAILKEYKECQMALEPLTLKNTALQIALGLEYLHANQVVHLDMKSPNVLLWHFPSPQDDRAVRIKQAGNVWIKIADYGISQVSTGLTLRVDNAPVGTPGFMAPELFDRAGQVISSEKVDVFAFGMVLFELLSQRSPFDNIQPQKRNHEVRDGSRPTLQAKETRTLVLLQELMNMCWDQEPESRPRMGQITGWIQASEFERLRAEIALREVKSISCACVCRILPEYEEEEERRNGGLLSSCKSSITELPKRTADRDDEYTCSLKSPSYLVEENGGETSSNGVLDGGSGDFGRSVIDLIVPNMLPSISLESVCIESMGGDRIWNDGEDVYQFLPKSAATFRKGSMASASSSRSHSSSSRMRDRRRRMLRARHSEEDIVGEDGEDVREKYFDPYTQIWMCGRDQRKGLLQIFTYNDGHPGSYHFSGYCSRDEITSMCAVRNMIWMGTSSGSIKIFHAPTLKTKFASTLETEGPEGTTTNRTILDILYVEELRSVLVANFSGEIWCFNDTLVEDGLRLQKKMEMRDCSPCYHLAKVLLNGGSKVEVWGTMENNTLAILERSPPNSRSWQSSELLIKPKDPKLRLCSYIVYTSFIDSSGKTAEHIWVSYRQRSVLVSVDARTREQRTILNCTEKLRSETSQGFQISTLTCVGPKVIVGTTTGGVAIFSSETCDLLNYFVWHKDKVRTLLAMPREVEPCICAEIPFNELSADLEDSAKSSSSQSSDFMGNSPSKERRRAHHLKRQTNVSPSHGIGGGKMLSSQLSHLDNKYCIPQHQQSDSILITSVGNGKLTYSTHSQSKEDKLKIFDKAAMRKSSYRMGNRQQQDDVVLLTWRS